MRRRIFDIMKTHINKPPNKRWIMVDIQIRSSSGQFAILVALSGLEDIIIVFWTKDQKMSHQIQTRKI